MRFFTVSGRVMGIIEMCVCVFVLFGLVCIRLTWNSLCGPCCLPSVTLLVTVDEGLIGGS